MLRNALTVGIRYAALRKQFGKDGDSNNNSGSTAISENPIMNYPTSQMRLIPPLAEHFAYRIATGDLVERWLEAQVNFKSQTTNHIKKLKN